jgi:hypothetical protein
VSEPAWLAAWLARAFAALRRRIVHDRDLHHEAVA